MKTCIVCVCLTFRQSGNRQVGAQQKPNTYAMTLFQLLPCKSKGNANYKFLTTGDCTYRMSIWMIWLQMTQTFFENNVSGQQSATDKTLRMYLTGQKKRDTILHLLLYCYAPPPESGGVLCYTLRNFECPSVRPSVRLSVRPSVRPSAPTTILVSATPPTVLGQSFWNFTGVLRMVWRYAYFFFQNPEIIFYHFFPIFNLDIFRALILKICIWSMYLVSATPPTVFGESFWNFTGVLRMVWRYAYCFFRILKLFFITFFAFLT